MQACPTSSQSSSGSSSITATADPCGSTPVHPRDFSHFSLSARAVGSPEEALVKGQQIWAQISATTADKSPTLTTDKFQASYPQIFTESTDENTLDSSIFSVFNILDPKVENDVLAAPLFAELAGIPTLRKRENNLDNSDLAYQFFFAPGLIVNTWAFRENDPVSPPDKQVPWDVIAMELYKEFKGAAGPTDLRFIMQYHIINPVTTTALEQLYTAAKMADKATATNTEWTKWDPTEACENTAVLTLLGTDNGVGAGFMLADYRATLEEKDIVNIYTRRQSGSWHMVIEYGSLMF
jgi:hypothetical protein